MLKKILLGVLVVTVAPLLAPSKVHAYGAAHVVGKTLADAAHASGKIFRVERAHPAEHARRKEAQRKSQHEHGGITERNHRISDDDYTGAQRKHEEV